MKKVLITSALILSTMTAYASREGNGGDPCVAKFTKRANLVYSIIKDIPFFKSNLNLNRLKSKLNEADIIVVKEDLYEKNGGIVPAWNNGKNLIKLNKELWCENFVSERTKITLHEFLGVSQPKLDRNFQISNELYENTGYSESNFENLLETGDNANLQEINFEHVARNSPKGIVLETKSTNSFNGTIYIQDSSRYQFRAALNCSDQQPNLVLSRVYASPTGGVNNWSYTKETFWAKYNFKNKKQCHLMTSKALYITDMDCLKVTVGMDTSSIVNYKLTNYSCN